MVTFWRQLKTDFSGLLPQKSHYLQASETQSGELFSSSQSQKHRLGSQIHSFPHRQGPQTGLVLTSSNRARFRTFINSSSAWPRSVSAAALTWLSSCHRNTKDHSRWRSCITATLTRKQQLPVAGYNMTRLSLSLRGRENKPRLHTNENFSYMRASNG